MAGCLLTFAGAGGAHITGAVLLDELGGGVALVLGTIGLGRHLEVSGLASGGGSGGRHVGNGRGRSKEEMEGMSGKVLPHTTSQGPMNPSIFSPT